MTAEMWTIIGTGVALGALIVGSMRALRGDMNALRSEMRDEMRALRGVMRGEKTTMAKY